jgi:chromosome segregation ATPase
VEYYDSCPPELAPAFEEAYESGRQLYVREQRVRDAEAAIAARRNEVLRLEDSILRRGFRVADATATPEQRTQAVLDTKQIAERIGRLKAEIAELEKDRARYERELETYRSTVASTK